MKIFKYNKSQAAMEFLMTYGWAILVVLAAIAALAYFGVLSPEKFLPEKCILSPGIACVSHKVTPTEAVVILSNGLGRTIIIDSIEIGNCLTTFTGTGSSVMVSGNQSEFTITGCTNGNSKEPFKGSITMKYTERSTNLSKTAYGTINTKIE